MSRVYVRSKKYVIRPSKRSEVLDFIKQNFRASKYQTAIDRVMENKAMSYKRWLYYFDLEYLDEILMEEDCVEIPIQEENNITEDLGI